MSRKDIFRIEIKKNRYAQGREARELLTIREDIMLNTDSPMDGRTKYYYAVKIVKNGTCIFIDYGRIIC